ncbi:MAG: TetR/AcrR family transcriptional regulator [Myxococcota bacterium]|jgi:AcrR family transcriptional regulator|nr:TetR/AcrR family transcriptional regulator [Myxococcota bacterium]
MVSKEPLSPEAQRIVDAALEKFRKHGIRRVSMDEIARELRVSKKTLYVHFSSKEQLVRGCAEAIASNVFPKAQAAMCSGGGAREKIAGLWQAFASLPRFISSEMMADLKTDYPEVWDEIHARRLEVFRHLEVTVEQGIRDGQVWPDIHPRVFAALMRAVLEHVMVPEVLIAFEFTPSDAVSTLLTLFQKGLLTPLTPKAGRSARQKRTTR